ncbi:MAG: phosphatidate phosphatase App1 family protein [Vicinamibacterales bacterium]
MDRQRALLIVIMFLLVTPSAGDDKEAVFVTSYGFLDGSTWVVPVRVKVQEPRNAAALGIDALLDKLGIGNPDERAKYAARIADFIADDQSRERVRIRFERDDRGELYSVLNAAGQTMRTDSTGIVEGIVRIDAVRARQLLAAQGATDGWLTFAADEHMGRGRVRLLEANGVSVISDIDDTIKITEVPAGKRVLARNTFCRDFAAAPELAARYAGLKGAAVHYVSGGPWQLYRPLAAFIADNNFPEGSFHMRVVGGSVLRASRSLEDLGNFVSADGTFNHKVVQISRIMRRFPRRTFILIGDSGERDPEVYSMIRSRFPAQVSEIVIRDVVDARRNAAARLTGMTVIAAPTIVAAGSPLHP